MKWNDRLRTHRGWLIGIGIFLAAIGLCEWAEWPFLRAPLERAAARGLQRQVILGQAFGIRFIGGFRFHTDRLVIGPPPQEQQPDLPGMAEPLLRAGDIRASIPYATLFRLASGNAGNLHIRSLEVGDINLILGRDEAGKANWKPGGSKTKDDGGPPRIPEFGRLVVRQGQLVLDDAVSRLKLQAKVSTQEGDAAKPDTASTGLHVTATGSYRDSPLKAEFHSSGLVPLTAAEAEAPPVPVSVNLHIGGIDFSLDGQAKNLAKFSDVQGKFSLSGPSLSAVGDIAGMTFPRTPAFDLKGTLAKTGAAWSANIAELAMGSSRLHGDFRFDPTPAVPQFTGHLGGKRLSLPDLGPAFGAGGKSAKRAGAHPATGRILPQREFDIPSLGRMNADVDINLDELYPGTGVIASFAPLQGKLSLRDSVLRIDDLLARASGGEVRGQLKLDARQEIPLWEANLHWSGVRLERFVKPRNSTQAPDRPGAPSPGYIGGSLAGRAEVHGRGKSTAAMLASLDGSARFWISDGRISHLLVEATGIDLAQALGVLVKGDDSLPMRCAVAGMAIKDGRVTTEVGVVDTRDSTLIASGGISLADERLDLLLRVHPKDVSPVSLRTPVHVEGTFSDPEIRIDKQPLGMRVVAAAALATINPLASLLALVDLGEPEKAVCRQALQRIRAPGGNSAPAKKK